MFQQVIQHKGFWRSVVSLGLAFIILFHLIKWAIEGFTVSYFTKQDPLLFFGGTILAGLFYGFLVSFGKFRRKIKEQQGQ
ncbi:hypothetical protein MG296_02055 [Flavobacteriaceae bacterium TK19130]|nr:hypothetical protein [Thermobacterium salinum]